MLQQTKAYADFGCDQVAFGMPVQLPMEYATETIRLFGDHVIPHFDKDSKHRTTRLREEAGGPLELGEPDALYQVP